MKTLAIMLFSLFLSITAVQAEDLKPYTGKPHPTLQLKDLSGTLHDLKQYQGKVVMVQFWATYCPPCIKEMPSMVRLKEKLAGKPFVILAVNMGEEEKEIKEFLTRVKTDFIILLDSEGKALSEWKVFVAPSTFLIDSAGTVRYTLQGGAEWDAPEMVMKISEMMPAP